MLSLFPTRWIAPFTGDLSSILWVPLSPMAHGASSIRMWLRPPVELRSDLDRAIATDRDLYRGLWHAEQIQVEELQKKLRAYEVVSAGNGNAGSNRLASAHVVARTASGGGLALRLNAGSMQGIGAGDIAVVDGDGIVGRIAPQVGAVSSTIVTVANRAFGRIDGYVVPADQERSKRPQVIAVQLLPDGNGFLRGDIDLGVVAKAGDLVRVKDPTWPVGAQGMRLGVVVEVRRKDAQPLRGEVFVRPAVDPAVVGEVVVKLSKDAIP